MTITITKRMRTLYPSGDENRILYYISIYLYRYIVIDPLSAGVGIALLLLLLSSMSIFSGCQYVSLYNSDILSLKTPKFGSSQPPFHFDFVINWTEVMTYWVDALELALPLSEIP